MNSEALASLGSVLLSSRDIPELCEKIVEVCAVGTPAEACALYLLKEDGFTLELQASDLNLAQIDV